jgi:hypothetical protein
MIKNIEGLQLPSLEKMLSSRFGYINSGKFLCEKCNYIGKNPLALSVHKRSCDKTNVPTTQEVDSVIPTINIQLATPPPPSVQPVLQQKQGKTVTKKGVSPPSPDK